MNQLPVINTYTARILMVSFFLTMKLQVLVLAAACLFFLVESIVLKTQVSKQKIVLAIVVGSGYLLCVSSFLFTPPAYRHVVSSISERKMSLLLIPLIFAFFTPDILETIKKEQIYFAYTCVVACIIGNLRFVYQFAGADWHTLNHVQYRVFLEQVMGIHPTYLGMYICYAICILLFAPVSNKIGGKVLKYVTFYLLLLFLLASLAKSPIIALVLIFIHFLWLKRKTLYRFRFQLIVLVGIVGAAYLFIPFFRQRVVEMQMVRVANSATNIHNNSINDRKMILTTDLDVLHQHWLRGVGPGRLQQSLNLHYLFYSISNQVSSGYYDPHNEYLWQWISFGIVGIILCISILVIHYLKAFRDKNYLYLYLLMICTTTFFTESVLARQHGVLLYSVFTTLFLFGGVGRGSKM